MTAQSQSHSLVNTIRQKLTEIGLTRKLFTDYSALLSGQLGRLVFSMVYFVVLTHTLTLGEFGIFASCSAIGIVLSRLFGLGYVSPLFRVATTKPELIGAHTGGFLVAALISLPPLLAIGGLIYAALYSDLIAFTTFLLIISAEIVCWRGVEATIIVLNGLNRYTAGSLIGIGGVAVKAIAASVLLFNDIRSLEIWAAVYFGSQAAYMSLVVIGFYPKQRLRWKPKAWLGRMRDAIGVSAAETLFYVQSEMDKVLVLALGGEILAGLYAIVMRLVDLTAMPLRALSTMLTQWIMRKRQSGEGANTGLKLDAVIGLTSVAALIAIALLLSLAPNILGESITKGASFLWLVLLVPAFRNAIELHTDLLYGHERMKPRVVLLAYLAVLKAVLLVLLLGLTQDFATVAIWLNVVFALLYIASALVTYGRVLKRSKSA